MALLLSLETSTQTCSVSLHNDHILLAERISKTERTAAAQLAVMIDEVFRDAGKRPKELQAVIVAAGPGSYTGLRIGVATAKGLCYALKLPLISVSTLQLMAFQFIQSSQIEENALLCPMLDARRMEVYCALFDRDGNFIEEVNAKVIDESSFSLELSNHPVYFFGEGADKCRNTIMHPNAKFVSGITPLASSLGVLGFEKFNQGQFENLNAFEPFYLKDFLIKKPISG